MLRQLCVAQRIDSKKAGSPGHTFSIIERAPFRLAEHEEIWLAIQAAGQSGLVIDEAYPEEAFQAIVVEASALNDPKIESAVKRARHDILVSEQQKQSVDSLSNELDSIFDSQREWLALRAMLVQAKRAKKSSRRAILLIN